MITISLYNLTFHSFHGVHEEEKILGNTFTVNISLSFQPSENISSLEQTINYESLYQIVKQRMAIQTTLLEILAQDLAQEMHAFDKRIKSISVSIEKKNPPIPNIEGSVGVTYKKDF